MADNDYILRKDAVQCAEDIADDLFGEGLDSTSDGARIVAEWLKDIPAAKVVSMEDYKHLLKVARAMHTWIFLNTCDEQKAYDECHLTDEDNDLLGYGGQFILAGQP